MDCSQIRLMLSAFQDGCVVESERRAVRAHLERCGECAEVLGQLEMIRQSVRSVPRVQVPVRLRYELRAMASRESSYRRRYAGFRGWVLERRERFALFTNNLMRPLAVPAAGGLASAVFLFAMLMPNFYGIVRSHIHDIPISLVTRTAVSSGFTQLASDTDIFVDVLVDEQGRVIDYSLPEGYGTAKSSRERRLLENTLLQTEFSPATSFGYPVTGWIRLKLNASQIDVKG